MRAPRAGDACCPTHAACCLCFFSRRAALVPGGKYARADCNPSSPSVSSVPPHARCVGSCVGTRAHSNLPIEGRNAIPTDLGQ
eukprot:scaffold17644_cov125-Isochrysis_galbana.AAC.1